jgi:iron(III) transport system ATP-binding protein
MRNAGIAQKGTPRDLYEAPASAFVADFIGEANLIPCEILSVSDGMAEIGIGSFRHHLASRGLTPGNARVAVRPSRVRIGAVGQGMPAKIAKATYVGSRMEYTVEAEFGNLFAVLDDVTQPLLPGAEVMLSFADSGPVLVPE